MLSLIVLAGLVPSILASPVDLKKEKRAGMDLPTSLLSGSPTLPTSILSVVSTVLPTSILSVAPNSLPTTILSGITTVLPTSILSVVPRGADNLDSPLKKHHRRNGAHGMNLPTSALSVIPTSLPTSLFSVLPSPLPTSLLSAVPTLKAHKRQDMSMDPSISAPVSSGPMPSVFPSQTVSFNSTMPMPSGMPSQCECGKSCERQAQNVDFVGILECIEDCVIQCILDAEEQKQGSRYNKQHN